MDTKEKNRPSSGQRRPRQEQTEQRPKKRPAAENTPERRQAPRKQAADRQQEQPARGRRAVREDGTRPSAPQGTGPRKSAPQRTPQQQKEARRRAAQQKKNQPDPRQKRTLKDNPLQNFISGIKPDKEAQQEKRNQSWEEKSRKRQAERAAEAERKRKQAERNNTPAVIYTQPQPFNRSRLLIQLMTITAVVAALVLGMSVFFKVGTITVSGAGVYSAWAVREASGIQEGDNLLTFSRAKAAAQIEAKLSYVNKARIGIKLPDTVNIYIEEAEVAYAIKSSNGDWWLMTSSGRVVEQINGAEAENHTQVLGVVLDAPEAGGEAFALEDVPTETNIDGELIPVTVTGAQRLRSALQILEALEANDIVGEAASVDVSRLEDIILWYGVRYQVNLGDTSRMEEKIAYMNGAILQMSDYQSGILDVSFKHWQDQVGYTPFS